jgi:hypothetical protein
VDPIPIEVGVYPIPVSKEKLKVLAVDLTEA